MKIDTLEERLAKLTRLHAKTEAEILRVADLLDSSQQRQRRSRLVIPPCGTETGYQRHHYRGEECEQCRVAHSAHNRWKGLLRRIQQRQADRP